MSELAFPRLTRPPLREALVDLRLSNELPPSFLIKLKGFDLNGFSNTKDIRRGGVKFEMAKDQPAQATVTTDELLGQRYERNDGAEVLQFRRNGVTLSILKNYTSWDAQKETVRNMWQRFLAVSGPVSVNRLAVRYINAIDLPAGQDYDEYLTAGPRIPTPLPQIVTGFIQRVVVPFARDNATAIITQTLETLAAGNVPVVLDIDVFSECSLDGASTEIWSRLDKLRSIKNEIFFSSLTAKVLESYR